MKEITLQLKPVGNHCNLHCSYCYAAPFKKEKYKILDLKLLEKVIKEALELSDNVIISWHGGEPTMVGLDYFKDYMKIVNKYKKDNQNVVNMLQTNATLITDDMAQFFKDNGFIISISLDGDETSHNKNRYNYKGQGSFKDTMAGVEKLRKHGIFPPLIATVTQSTINDGLKNFNFFVNNGLKEIKFSHVYDSDTDEFSINNEEWYNYTRSILDEWLKLQDRSIKIREIDEILSWIIGKNLNICANQGMCLSWLSVDEDGDIYPCEYLRKDNPYGNIKEMNLKDVFSSDSYLKFKNKVISMPDKCKKCELLNFCHNGCPATRIKENKLSYDGLYVYCEQRKSLINDIKNMLGGDYGEE